MNSSDSITIPNEYKFFNDPNEHMVNYDHIKENEIPVIDFELLMSFNEKERKAMVHKLGNACRDWGFFVVINHGVPETLMKDIIYQCKQFFELPQQKLKEYKDKGVFSPIRYGTSYSPAVETTHFWRNYLKLIVHPVFNSPSKPHGFSETARAYSQQLRKVRDGLLRAIYESLGLDPNEVESSLNFNRAQQTLIANYYPPCPQPDLAIGLPPHSDHGLLTILVHNQVQGLQIMHKGKWLPIKSSSNGFLINVADQLEVISNGRYKSVLHRVMVNNMQTRVSVAVANGPSLDSVIEPAQPLLEPAKFRGLTYRSYLQAQQTKVLDGKSGLDMIRIEEDMDYEHA